LVFLILKPVNPKQVAKILDVQVVKDVFMTKDVFPLFATEHSLTVFAQGIVEEVNVF